MGPENKIFLMTGPLTGCPVYSPAKYHLATKSPLTGIYLASNAAGFFGPELKRAGYDGLIVEGRAESPTFVTISDDRVEFRNAGHLWGMPTGDR